MNEVQDTNNRAFADSLAGLAANTYGQNYQQERQRQMQGMLFAPQLAQTDYADAQALLGVGDIRREQDQARLNEQYGDWLAQQNWPYQNLDVLGNAIRTTMGAGGTTTMTGPNPYQPNRAAGALGGAMGGYSLGSMLPATALGGFGGPIGAGIGLLAGLLG